MNKHSKIRFGLSMGLASLLLSTTSSLLAACPKSQDVVNAYQKRDLNTLNSIHKQINQCKENTYHYYNFYIAQAYSDDAAIKKMKGKVFENRLNLIMRLNPNHWPTLAELAKIKEERILNIQNPVGSFTRWEQIYNAYDQLLQTIHNPVLTPDKVTPQRRFILDIQEKVTHYQQLVFAPKNGRIPNRSARNGRYHTITRNTRAERTILPIRFDSGKSNLNKSALYTATTAFNELRGASPDITVIGHTDPIGSHAYNDQLSRERASTFKQFLTQKGYKGHIKIVGMGERKPLKMSQRQRAILEQTGKLNEVLRRVEVKLEWNCASRGEKC